MEGVFKVDVENLRFHVRKIRENCIDCISFYLKDTDEEHPLECDITIGEDSAYALSSLEMPHVSGMYKDRENLYAIIDGYELDLDFVDVMDLLTIVEELQK